MNYYNEFDPAAAAWLRELIAAGAIPPGVVDETDIRDVNPDDLRDYTQCHFFAGIGGWAEALRLAGVSPDEPLWTGSCPCPPFSAAGKGSECPSCGGKSCLSHPLVTAGWLCLDCGDEWRGDDRHLLPEFLRLWGECRPPSVFGEQVASADGRLWFYTLRATLERVAYASGCADLCAASVGAPHIRQRLFFGAHDLRPAASGVGDGERLGRLGRGSGEASGRQSFAATERSGDAGGLGHPGDQRLPQQQRLGGDLREACGPDSWQAVKRGSASIGGMADADGRNPGAEREQPGGQQRLQPEVRGVERVADSDDGRQRLVGGSGAELAGRASDIASLGPWRCGENGDPRPTDGAWRDADWLFSRDGKWRPVEPGTFPLAHGVSGRVGLLRGYGNAIVPQVAAEFVQAYREARHVRVEPQVDLLTIMGAE